MTRAVATNFYTPKVLTFQTGGGAVLMEAGLTDHVWSLEELVGLLSAQQTGAA
jgi:hypothetical protein